MSAIIVHIGYCVCCQRMRVLDSGPACEWCRAVHGQRFVELAARFRNDPAFARAVLAKMSEAQLEMLRRYWIGPPVHPRRVPRGESDTTM